MSDLDVSLKLKLVNQLSRPAEEAERDLKELQKAAERLGQTRGGNGLGKELDQLGQKATDAKGKIGAIETEASNLKAALGRIDNSAFEGLKADAIRSKQAVASIGVEADELRRKLGQTDNAAFGNLKGDASNARQAISGIGQEATEVRQKLGQIDDGAFEGLKADARSAEAAVRQIGTAADDASYKLRNMKAGPVSGSPTAHPAYGPATGPTRGSFGKDAAGAAYERLGMDTYLPLAGMGAAYMAGGGIASGAVVAGAVVKAAGDDEFESDQLMVTGGYDAKQQQRYDEFLERIGAKRGIGTRGAQEVFGALQAGGLSHQDAAAMTDNAVVFAKAARAEPVDSARTTIALRDNMDITAEQMPLAYDTMGLGGKEGKFEVKDMARNYPSILALMGSKGSRGLPGLRLTTAMAQSVVSRAGSPDQASTAIEAMLNDITAPDTSERAKEYGIDPIKTMDRARSEGKDPVYALLNEYKNKIGTDERKFKDVFRNTTAAVGYTSVFEDMEEIDARMKRMEAANGTIKQDYVGATDNFNSQRDRLMANIGKNVKDVAKPVLPALTKVTGNIADKLEQARERQDIQRNQEELFKVFFPPTADGKPKFERKGPSDWERFLYGKAAEPDFEFQDHIRETMGLKPKASAGEGQQIDGNAEAERLKRQIGVNLQPAAEQSMSGYNDALSAEGAKSETIAQGIADRIKAMLGFTVSPTIAPTYIQPGTPAAQPASPAPGQQSAIQPTPSSIKLTQNISSPNSRLAADRAKRLQNREIRQAEARSLAGTGRNLA